MVTAIDCIVTDGNMVGCRAGFRPTLLPRIGRQTQKGRAEQYQGRAKVGRAEAHSSSWRKPKPRQNRTGLRQSRELMRCMERPRIASSQLQVRFASVPTWACFLYLFAGVLMPCLSDVLTLTTQGAQQCLLSCRLACTAHEALAAVPLVMPMS